MSNVNKPWGTPSQLTSQTYFAQSCSRQANTRYIMGVDLATPPPPFSTANNMTTPNFVTPPHDLAALLSSIDILLGNTKKPYADLVHGEFNSHNNSVELFKVDEEPKIYLTFDNRVSMHSVAKLMNAVIDAMNQVFAAIGHKPSRGRLEAYTVNSNYSNLYYYFWLANTKMCLIVSVDTSKFLTTCAGEYDLIRLVCGSRNKEFEPTNLATSFSIALEDQLAFASDKLRNRMIAETKRLDALTLILDKF